MRITIRGGNPVYRYRYCVDRLGSHVCSRYANHTGDHRTFFIWEKDRTPVYYTWGADRQLVRHVVPLEEANNAQLKEP